MKKNHANGIGIRLTGIGSLISYCSSQRSRRYFSIYVGDVARFLVAAIHCRFCGKAIEPEAFIGLGPPTPPTQKGFNVV